MRKKLRIQQQNSGFSLVELIIAIAILVIVTGAVCGFIVVTSRNYATANNDISVQQEAQLALNQMSDVIIDATRSINYVGYDASNQPVKVMKDSEFTFTPEKKALIVYNTAAPTSGEEDTELHNYMFYWQKSDESLYFSIADVGGKFPMPGEADSVLLAENVTDFQVDLSQVEERRVVKLKLNFKAGNRKFEMANNITVRNKVVINDAEIEPLDRRVRVNVAVKEPTVILEPGETFQFSTPKVTGTNLLNKNVTWSINGTVGDGTSITEDGILKIGEQETHDSFLVKVTTKAVNDDSNSPAEDTVTVYVKRVKEVTLFKSEDDSEDAQGNTTGPLEVMQGSTFTISGTVKGVKLGSKCDSCGDLKDQDLTGWKVTAGTGLLTRKESDESSAVFQVNDDAKVDSIITIQAASELSTRRPYATVYGEITLKIVERKTPAKPTGGVLRYGGKTKMDELLKDFTTTIEHHVIAVRVVDNSGESPDQIVAYHNKGWNVWVEPECFNLDLNKDYTFYMQGLEAVSKENYRYWQEHGGTVKVSSNEEIWTEYINHISSEAPYGYEGTMFNCSEVYYTVLKSPMLAFTYGGKRYVGENLTCKDYNLLSSTNASVLDGISLDKSYDKRLNIDIERRVMNSITYSLYVGEGNDISQWTKIRTFDGNTRQYVSGDLDNKYVSLSINGHEPVLSIKDKNEMNTCGLYHIVPGFIFTRTQEVKLDIVGEQNYDRTNVGPVYYEAANSTIHVTIQAETTMDVESPVFTGGVCFPLPREMANSSWQFPNLDNSEWQDANIHNGYEVSAIPDSTGKLTKIKLTGVRYRRVSDNTYEVEPFVKISRDGNFSVEAAFGIYQCTANGKKWERKQPASGSNNGTLVFEGDDGKDYLCYYPVPSDDNFGNKFNLDNLKKGEIQKREGEYIIGYDVLDPAYGARKDIGNVKAYCEYDKTTKVYTLTLVKNETSYNNNSWATCSVYGIYKWSEGQKMWSRTTNTGTFADPEANLKINMDGQSYCTYIPGPEDTSFWFSGSSSDERWIWMTFLKEGDMTGSQKKETSVRVRYTRNDGTTPAHTIELISDSGQTYGKYTYNSTWKTWELMN